MPRFLSLRALTDAEAEAIATLARSRTAAARAVERARIIALARDGVCVPAIARTLALGEDTVRRWLTRFNAEGIAGLADRPRCGHPVIYTAEDVGLVIATALTDPQTLGQPFGSWTLDRLVIYLTEECGLSIKRSRIDEVLVAEGLRWRTQETWFGARVDPGFAQKRGRLSGSTPIRQRAAS
jgi:transposase